MTAAFSEVTQHWLRMERDVIPSIERLFRDEWAQMLREVASALRARGWNHRLFDERTPDMLQLQRPHWPPGEAQAHFEVHTRDSLPSRPEADLFLHIEDKLPGQEAVLRRIRGLLKPYESLLLSRGACSLREEPLHEVLKGSLPLADVTPEILLEAIEKIVEAESFVDEAMLLAGKTAVWRTDFFAADPSPCLDWREGLGTGPRGGWEPSAHGGRLDSPCLKLFGERSNYHEGKNILILRHPDLHDLANGQRAYCSAVVHASQGGEVRFYAEAPKEGNWTVAFDAPCRLEAADRWQLVSWTGKVASPEGYDFARQGLYAFLIVKAPPAGLRIDSVELGVVP
ncbi:MAG: hypothetical protein HY721_22315 [Planctomycetes bacterium]|nr:hypothetical protein [Planctomycetota bacterium]